MDKEVVVHTYTMEYSVQFSRSVMSDSLRPHNRSSSLMTDRKYLETIAEDNYYPSPALFVYTLPNIITGEIAIRNKYNGETSFYILPERDEKTMEMVLRAAFLDKKTRSAIAGWLDCRGESDFEADVFIVEKED